ncbi:MAG: hypothetical protein KDC61_01740, partial [Saprospiraceae bacterium]|nr:hypothetical protein [Saprospiraceae bacterium]
MAITRGEGSESSRQVTGLRRARLFVKTYTFGRSLLFFITQVFTYRHMRQQIVAGNWKMNKTLDEGLELTKMIL